MFCSTFLYLSPMGTTFIYISNMYMTIYGAKLHHLLRHMKPLPPLQPAQHNAFFRFSLLFLLWDFYIMLSVSNNTTLCHASKGSSSEHLQLYHLLPIIHLSNFIDLSLCVCKLLLDMWPTLVANKIFKKRLGSSDFIADFPSFKEPLLGIVDFDHNPKFIHNDHKGTQKCK